MKRNKVLELLEKLKRCGIKDTDKVLRLDEEILLALLELSDLDFKVGLRIALKEKNKSKCLGMITNITYIPAVSESKILDEIKHISIELKSAILEKSIDEDPKTSLDALNAVDDIISILTDFNMIGAINSKDSVYTYFSKREIGIIVNSISLRNYIIKRYVPLKSLLEGIKILSSAEEKTSEVFDILTSKYAIDNHIDIKGARLVLKAKKDFQYDYVRRVLRTDLIKDPKIALKIASILSNVKEQFNAFNIYGLIVDTAWEVKDYGYLLEAIKKIAKSNNLYNAVDVRDILNKIYGINPLSKDDALLYADIINKADSFEKSRVIKNILLDVDIREYKVGVDIANLILNFKGPDFVLGHVKYVATNPDMLASGLVLEATNILLKAKKEYTLEYASYVLTDFTALESGIALEGAELILKSKHKFNAKYASRILCNFVFSGIALEAAELVNECTNEKAAELSYKIIRDTNATKNSAALDYIRLISKIKYPEIIDMVMYNCRYTRSELTTIEKKIDLANAYMEQKLEEANNDHLVSYVDSLTIVKSDNKMVRRRARQRDINVADLATIKKDN